MSVLAPIAEADEPPATASLQAGARPVSSASSHRLSLPSTPSPSPPLAAAPVAVARTPSSSRSADRAAFREARAVYESGVALSRAGNPVAATVHFRQAAAVFGEIEGHESRRDKALWQAGMCYAAVAMRAKSRGEGETAKAALEQARSCFHFVNAVGKEAMAIYQLGLITAELGTAAELIKAAALLYADLGDESREAMCYAELGHLFTCLLLYLKLGDSHREGKVLYTIGLFAAKLADRTTAFNYLAQARVIFRRRGDKAEEADASYQLGKLCVRKRAYEPAVQYFEEASTLFHDAGLLVDEAWASYRLALVMLKVRSAPLAIDYLAEARKLFAEAPTDERHAEGSCLLRIAEILAGTVGSVGEGVEGGEDVRDEERARQLLEEAARLLTPAQTPAPASSTPHLSRARSRRPPPPISSSPAPDRSALVRRRSTMSAARAEERRKRLELATAEGASASTLSDGGTAAEDSTSSGAEVRESGRAAAGAKGRDAAWWAVRDR
ncbi:hypothetical protein JCM3770_002919 [Rhodotorula araucariae]